MLRLILVLASLTLTASGAAAQCCGDCNGDGEVTINELITAVNNALQGCAAPTPAQCCGDCNGDGQVTINELIIAVNNALQGCAVATPTPTSGRSPTPTKRPTKTPTPVPTCPFKLTDNSAGSGGACTFLGTYNRGCGMALNSSLTSNGSMLSVTIATLLDNPPFVAFYANVVDANNGNLVAWSTDGLTFNVTAGSVQLANNGSELIIFPNDSPFAIQSCNFVQYLGNYTGQVGAQAAASSASEAANADAFDQLRARHDRPVPDLAPP
jgi:hypothetical protein